MRARASKRRGTALVLVLLVLGVVASFSALVLQLTSNYSRRQTRAEQDARAFYLAEAGLSEAYYALTLGGTGRIGSPDLPAACGDGLVWVDVVEDGKRVRLESNALCGTGRASLAVTVERVEEPVGMFSKADVAIGARVLVDGYDSREGTYLEQAGVDPAELLTVDLANFQTRWDPLVVPQSVLVGTDRYLYFYRDSSAAYLVHDPESEGEPAVAARMPHTDGGGRLATNGSITFGRTEAEVYGDAIPGPGGTVATHDGILITGHTRARPAPLSLDPVVVPAVTSSPAVVHEGAVPFVIPPSEVGYDGLHVAAGSEVVVQGPAVVVLGSLELEADAELSIENEAGAVHLYVLESADLAAGSFVTTQSQDPSQLTFQVAAEADPVVLDAHSQFHGMVYAPEAHVAVGGAFEVFGVLAVDSMDLGENARLHFDRGIAGRSGPFSLPLFISWEIIELPAVVRRRSLDYLASIGLSRDDLQQPHEVRETYSWIAHIELVNTDGKTVFYDGPYEQWGFRQVLSYTSFVLEPPDVATAQPWWVYTQYVDWLGVTQTYDGPVETAPLADVATLVEHVVTPPPELLALGFTEVRIP